MIASTSTGADADAVLAGAVLAGAVLAGAVLDGAVLAGAVVDDPPVTPLDEGDRAPPAGFDLEPAPPVATAPAAALETLDQILSKMPMQILTVGA